MARPPGLFRRGGVWYYRRLVPDDLRPIIGKAEIRGSLRTYDYAEACGLAHLAAVDADIELAAARRKLNSQSDAGRTQNTDPPPDEVGIEALVLASFHDREREAKAELEALDDLASQTFASITTTILAEHGVRVDWPTTGPISAAATVTRHDKMQLPSVIVAPDSPEYQKAAEMVRRASLEYVRRSRGRIAQTDFDPINGDPMFQNVTTEVAPAPVENEITFQGLVDEFMNDPKRSNLKPKSKKNHEGLFRLLVQIVGGDKPARSITREPHRVCRRLFGLSQATIASSLICA